VKLDLTSRRVWAPRRPVNRVEAQARKLMPLECDDHRCRAAWSLYRMLVLLAVFAIVAVVVYGHGVASRLSLGPPQEAPMRLGYSGVCLAELRSSTEALERHGRKGGRYRWPASTTEKTSAIASFTERCLPSQ
jgi:hypothetical protein